MTKYFILTAFATTALMGLSGANADPLNESRGASMYQSQRPLPNYQMNELGDGYMTYEGRSAYEGPMYEAPMNFSRRQHPDQFSY